MDRIEDIRIFVSIAEEGGVSAAALRLRMSKSAVSRRLAALERRLGVALITRTTRTQRLTQAGQSFYEDCTQILAHLERAETHISHSAGSLSGNLTVTAPLHFGHRHLTPLIADFLRRHDGLTIDLGLSDNHANLVEDGYDLAIRVGKLRDSTMRARKLCAARLISCASPAYLERRGTPSKLVDLSRHDVLMHRSGAQISQWMFEAPGGGTGRAQVTPRLVTNNDYVLLDLAVDGFGIVCMPSFVVQEALLAGQLIEILPEISWCGVDVHALYPQGTHLPPRVRTFIDFLAARLKAEGQVD